MKKFAAAIVLLCSALYLNAATRITVAQLGQTIAEALGKSDETIADQLSTLELTQRLSASARSRIESALPGPKSKLQLSILADQSAFLDLPPAEIPALPAPDPTRQREIMALVVKYVTQSTRQLPNFLATRETRSFEDRPAGAYAYLPLHQANQISVSVLYREGKEVDRTSSGKKVATSMGLVSWGEFGPILSTVLLDAARSQLGWSHWEQGAENSVAVFRYAVPREKSQYQLQMCGPNPGCASTLSGYHGEIAVDPASGAIFRITVIADIEPGSNLEHNTGLAYGSIMVEYGQVEIGGKMYICPGHSVAIAQLRETQAQHGVIAAEAIDHSPRKTLLNSVSFTNYHVYRGESRMLSDAEAEPITGKPDVDNAAPPPASTAAGQSETSTVEAEAASTPPSPVSEPAAASPLNPQPAAAADLTPEPKTDSDSSPQPSPAGSRAESPAVPSSTAADIPGTPVFRSTTRQVLIDVLVSKRNGDPVSGLPQSDFSVAEEDRPQIIDFFQEHSSSAAAPPEPPAMPPLPPGAANNVPASPQSAALYVFLLDSLNAEPQDQVYVQQKIVAYLHKLDPGTQVAIFSLGSTLRLLQGFTSDPAKLLAAVSRKDAERGPMAQTRSDDAEDAQHSANLAAMRGASEKLNARADAVSAAQAYSAGAKASMTFEALNALARYLEGIPGRKNLIWFSSSFPVSVFPSPSELGRLKDNPNLPGYAKNVRQTSDLFTLSKIAVYPVSGAGVASSNVNLAVDAGSGRPGGSNGTAALAAESLNSGSALGNMEQLADSTGGRSFATNDIESTIRKIVHDTDSFYTLGYVPTNAKEDGGFRRVDVKVSGGRFKLAYRQGYNASNRNVAQAENPVTPLLELGMPSATGILFGASIAPSSSHSTDTTGQNPALRGPLTRYSVFFVIRAQDVAFEEDSTGKRIGKLLLGVKAYGADGAALNWQATREIVEFDAAQFQSVLKSGIPTTIDIDLPASTSAQFVTAVYDLNSTRSGSLEIPLRP